MLIRPAASRLLAELEIPKELRRFGSGWISGTLALASAVAALLMVVALRYQSLLAHPDFAVIRDHPLFTAAIYFLLIVGYALAALSLILRSDKVLGFTAMTITLAASLIGSAPPSGLVVPTGGIFLGLDFFVLNVLFLGLLFVPLERMLPHDPEQAVFRDEWREDIFYYLISSLFVQILTFLSLAPSRFLVGHAELSAVRAFFGGMPWLVQVVVIMFLTDLAQYWVHRAFHQIPALWRFHAVHHSARSMDWIAGARMHFIEIIVLRAVTATPMFALGFDQSALQAYILIVYIYSSFIHANMAGSFGFLEHLLVVPRFHHWHHGVDKEAIDVNFAIHFPILDRLFGTHHLPKGQWPAGYGIAGHPVPKGYWKQFLYPFRRDPG